MVLAQGQGGHSWTWLGAAMAATAFPFAVVTAPAGRQGSKLRAVVSAFRDRAGDKPVHLQVKLSWATDGTVARHEAHVQWRTNVLEGEASQELRTPRQFEDAARHLSVDDVCRAVRVSADLQRHADWLSSDLELGFERLCLHNVNRGQAAFIDAFGETVWPALRSGRP